MDLSNWLNNEALAKLLYCITIVIPAKAGIQVFQGRLDPGFRRGDEILEFCKYLQLNIGSGDPILPLLGSAGSPDPGKGNSYTIYTV